MQKLFFILIMSVFLISCELIHKRGGADADEILNVYKDQIQEAQRCFEPILVLKQEVKGYIKISWTVDGKGRVIRSNVTEDNLGYPEINLCLMKNLKTIHFPPASRFSTSTVVYTHHFSTKPKSSLEW